MLICRASFIVLCSGPAPADQCHIVALAAGKPGDAEQMHSKVLEARQRILGPEHQYTLISMSNLALTLRDQGKCCMTAAFCQLSSCSCKYM